MDEQQSINSKIRKIILIVIGSLFVLSLIVFLITESGKNNKDVGGEPDVYDKVQGYQNTDFDISESDADNNITISAGPGYRNIALYYLKGKAKDPTNYKITFTDYTNPFEAYE